MHNESRNVFYFINMFSIFLKLLLLLPTCNKYWCTYFLCDKLNAILNITTSAEEQYTFFCLCISARNMNLNSSLLRDPHKIENLQCNPNELTVFTLNCFVYQIYNIFEKLWPSVNLPDLMSIIHYKFYNNSLHLL